MKSTSHNASRRSALKTVAAGAAALAMPMIWTPSRAASKRIVVRDDGGIYSKAPTPSPPRRSAAWWTPATTPGTWPRSASPPS
ncbi:hypothetical protein G6F24_018344 [Rhizopus arrhizus]|nr:hypothetical protein G6F24_018344 [Rhizopus arrhizus]